MESTGNNPTGNRMAEPHKGLTIRKSSTDTVSFSYSEVFWHFNFGLWAGELADTDTLYAPMLSALAANDDKPQPQGREQ